MYQLCKYTLGKIANATRAQLYSQIYVKNKTYNNIRTSHKNLNKKIRSIFIQKFKLHNVTPQMQNCISFFSMISVGFYGCK